MIALKILKALVATLALVYGVYSVCAFDVGDLTFNQTAVRMIVVGLIVWLTLREHD